MSKRNFQKKSQSKLTRLHELLVHWDTVFLFCSYNFYTVSQLPQMLLNHQIIAKSSWKRILNGLICGAVCGMTPLVNEFLKTIIGIFEFRIESKIGN